MDKKPFSHIKLYFLLFLILLGINSCNYKDSGFFAPTSSIPGEDPMLGVPVLTYPSNGSSNLGRNLTLEWTQVSDATSYDLDLKIDGGNYGDENSLTVTGITENQYDMEELQYSEIYWWRVRAVSANLVGEYSLEYSFATMDEPASTYILNISVNGNGTVTSHDNGIDCGSDCSEEYEEGTEVTITAEAADGWIFDRWSGNIPESCSADSPTCTFTMNNPTEITAYFIEGFQAPLIADITGAWQYFYTFTNNTCDGQTGEFSVPAEVLLLDEPTNEIGVQFPDAPDLIRGIYNTQSGPDAGWFTGMTGMVDLGGYYAQEFWDVQFRLVDGIIYLEGNSLVEYSVGSEPEDVFCIREYDLMGEKK